MRWLLFLLLLPCLVHSQDDDTTKYIRYQYTYGNRIARYWADKVLRPPTDTTYGKTGLAIKGTKLFYGDGVLWREAGGSAVWGGITGTLSNQTDLQAALDLKVPTARTITINGTAQDLSANRTWTVGDVFTTRQINTGYGINGGGDLSANRTFVVDSSELSAYYLRLADSTGTGYFTQHDATLLEFVDTVFFSSAPKIDTLKYSIGGSTYPWYILDRQSGLIEPGIVFHDSLLVFSVSPAIYYIDGVRYTSPRTTVILSAADPTDPRKDVIALDATGVIVIEGTPDANPAEPQVLPSQIRLTVIDIDAGATVPTNVTTVVIYDENTEWVLSATGLTANGNGASNVFHFSKTTDVGAFTAGQSFRYTNGSDVDRTDYVSLRFYLRLKATFAASAQLQLSWLNNGIAVTTAAVSLTNGNFGYSRTVVGSYQEITSCHPDLLFLVKFP